MGGWVRSRILQRLFTLASAASLLLCLAATALWVRSHFRHDTELYSVTVDPVIRFRNARTKSVRMGFSPNGEGRANYSPFSAEVASGDVCLRWYHANDLDGGRRVAARWVYQPESLDDRNSSVISKLRPDLKGQFQTFPAGAWTVGGYGYRSSDYPASQQRIVLIPIWGLILPSAVLPAVWVARALARRKRLNDHRCEKCGYDLRATPDRCPECGHFPEKITA